MFAAFKTCTMLLAQTSWKGLTFYYKCKRQSTCTVEYYNRVPSRPVSLWILHSVSPPGLRCFQQQNHRRLLILFELYHFIIESDTALVSRTFEITVPQFWVLMASSRLTICRTEIFSAPARIVPAPNDLVHHKYGTQTTQKSYPRGVQFYIFVILFRWELSAVALWLFGSSFVGLL